MRLYRRGGVWWVYFLARNGERIRRTTRQTDRKRADVVARDIERRHGDPTYSAEDDATLSGAITAMLAGGVHRYCGKPEDVTEAVVEAAERNTARLREWWTNYHGRAQTKIRERAWKGGAT